MKLCQVGVFAIAHIACGETVTSDDIDADALPRLIAEEDLRIGSVEDPEIGFSRINGVDVDRDGQVYVFEGQDMQIRVFSPDGRPVRRIGRQGARRHCAVNCIGAGGSGRFAESVDDGEGRAPLDEE